MINVRTITYAACIAAAAMPASAITITAGADRPTMALRPQTEVYLSAPDGLSSKALRLGESFTLRVARDVFVGASLVIPRGTPAHGRVTYRTGKGAFGKSAKIEFDLIDIVLDGSVVPIEGHYRLEGRGNTWATVGVAFFVCIPCAAFVTGRSAAAEPGQMFAAYTTAPIALTGAAYELPGMRAGLTNASFEQGAAPIMLQANSSSGGAPRLLPAASPSGYCYDVPRDYAGLGSARFPVLTRLMPGCFEVSR